MVPAFLHVLISSLLETSRLQIVASVTVRFPGGSSLLPLVPLGFWMLKRRIHRAKTLRLTPHYLVVGDSRWSRDELREIAVDQSSQPTGRERGLRRALRDEQARTSHRVVLYRGSKPIVVARDLSLRRAEYLSEVLTEWARAGHDDAAANA